MAEVASAPVESRAELARARPSAQTWAWLVGLSLALLVAVSAVIGVEWLASQRVSASSYFVGGSLMGVQIRVVSGDVVVVGGGAQSGVTVHRFDRSTFGRGPVEWRREEDGRLQIGSECPRLAVGACSASYRLVVPDDMPVSVRADHGSIRVEGFRGSASLATGNGAIMVDGFCGYMLHALSLGGDIAVAASCSPQHLELRSRTGNVSATVPPGRYRIDASEGSGPTIVRGLTADPNAPWEILAVSTTGKVAVEAGS